MIFIFLNKVHTSTSPLLGVLAALTSAVDLAEPFLTVIVLMVHSLTAGGIEVESELHCWCLLHLIVPSLHI